MKKSILQFSAFACTAMLAFTGCNKKSDDSTSGGGAGDKKTAAVS